MRHEKQLELEPVQVDPEVEREVRRALYGPGWDVKPAVGANFWRGVRSAFFLMLLFILFGLAVASVVRAEPVEYPVVEGTWRAAYALFADDGVDRLVMDASRMSAFVEIPQRQALLEPGSMQGLLRPAQTWQGSVLLAGALPSVGELLFESVRILYDGEVGWTPLDGSEGRRVKDYMLELVGAFAGHPFAFTQPGHLESMDVAIDSPRLSFRGDAEIWLPAWEEAGVLYEPCANLQWYAVVPEPATALLFGLGLFGLGCRR